MNDLILAKLAEKDIESTVELSDSNTWKVVGVKTKTHRVNTSRLIVTLENAESVEIRKTQKSTKRSTFFEASRCTTESGRLRPQWDHLDA